MKNDTLVDISIMLSICAIITSGYALFGKKPDRPPEIRLLIIDQKNHLNYMIDKTKADIHEQAIIELAKKNPRLKRYHEAIKKIDLLSTELDSLTKIYLLSTE